MVKDGLRKRTAKCFYLLAELTTAGNSYYFTVTYATVINE